jgi:hypothetical protein
MFAPDISPLIAIRAALMQDACTVTRPADAGATPDLDPDTGLPVPGTGSPIYSGPCTLSDPSTALRGGRTSNDEAGVPDTRLLKLPIDSAGLQPGDLVVVTASRFAPGLVGDRFTVDSESERSYATSRRYTVRGSSWPSS